MMIFETRGLCSTGWFECRLEVIPQLPPLTNVNDPITRCFEVIEEPRLALLLWEEKRGELRDREARVVSRVIRQFDL